MQRYEQGWVFHALSYSQRRGDKVIYKGHEPLGPGGDPYPARYGKPDLDRLDALVGETARYFREREQEIFNL